MSVSTKQRSCDSGLAAVPSPSCSRLGADACLGLVAAEGKHGAPQLALIEAVQHVGLVPARIAGSVERHQRAPAPGAGVMTGDEMARARGTSALQQHAELDALIALHARIRRDALRIAVLEIAHDVGLEILLEIPDVVREVEHRGDAPGVIDGVDRAAPTIADGLAGRPATSPA